MKGMNNSDEKLINVYEINDWADVAYYCGGDISDQSIVLINNLQDIITRNPECEEIIDTLIAKNPSSCFVTKINVKRHNLGVSMYMQHNIHVYYRQREYLVVHIGYNEHP